MYVSFGQKVVVSIVGLLFALGTVLLFSWWLAILALAAMVPFFLKVLTA